MAVCELSDLARALHDDLPYVSALEVNDGALPFSDPNAIIRGAFWGAVIVLLSFVLLVISCVWCCCSCHICQGQHVKPGEKAVPWCLGVTVLVFTLLTIGVLSVSFWAEQQINSDFSMHASDILGIIPTDDTLEGIYLTFELARHWVVIAVLVVLLFLAVITLLVVVLAPLCKSDFGVMVSIILMAPTILLLGVLSGITLCGLVFQADVCAGAYEAAPSDLCTTTDPDVVLTRTSLDFFCNDLMTNLFIVMILGCGLVVLLVLMQAFGIMYAESIVNYFKQPTATPQPAPRAQHRGANVRVGQSPNMHQNAGVPMKNMFHRQQPPHQLYPQHWATPHFTAQEPSVAFDDPESLLDNISHGNPEDAPPKYDDMFPPQV